MEPLFVDWIVRSSNTPFEVRQATHPDPALLYELLSNSHVLPSLSLGRGNPVASSCQVRLGRVCLEAFHGSLKHVQRESGLENRNSLAVAESGIVQRNHFVKLN